MFRDTVITDEEAQQLMCPPSPIGIIHILRKHILRLFGPPSPQRKHIFWTESRQKLQFSNPSYPFTSAYVIYERSSIANSSSWREQAPKRKRASTNAQVFFYRYGVSSPKMKKKHYVKLLIIQIFSSNGLKIRFSKNATKFLTSSSAWIWCLLRNHQIKIRRWGQIVWATQESWTLIDWKLWTNWISWGV